jgi:hypothetical protein
MGLKNTIKLKGDVVLTDSYLKIGNISIICKNGNVNFNFNAYKDKYARDLDEKNTLSTDLSCTIDSDEEYYKSNILPLINSLKSEIYKWSKTNGYETFSDII